MKNFFIAYRFSGELPDKIAERMAVVRSGLKVADIEAYSNLAEQEEYDREQTPVTEIVARAFAKIDASDGLFVLIASDDKSEGQLIEVGYALAKGKTIIAAVKQDTKTYVDTLADQVVYWKDLEDLQQRLEAIKV